MAGHSHSSNIKHRKDRQDSAKSQLFLKLRRKFEQILRKEGEVNEKSLSLARENKFPKEKLRRILEAIRKSGKVEFTLKKYLYKGENDLVIYFESLANFSDLEKKFNLKRIPSSLFNLYFFKKYYLRVDFKRIFDDGVIEDFFLSNFPEETWNNSEYVVNEKLIVSDSNEVIKGLKNIISNNFDDDIEILNVSEKFSFFSMKKCSCSKCYDYLTIFKNFISKKAEIFNFIANLEGYRTVA